MVKIYGQSGSLSEFLNKLKQFGIKSINSLEDVRSFKINFKDAPERIRAKNRVELLRLVNELKKKYENLSREYDEKLKMKEKQLLDEKVTINLLLNRYAKKEENILLTLVHWYQRNKLLKRKSILETRFEEEKRKQFSWLASSISATRAELEDREKNVEKWINQVSRVELDDLRLTNSLIDEYKSFYYGAEGEEAAVAELKKLPDTYVVINNFCRHFHRPINDKKNGDAIYSIQVDHVVIGPSGLYMIETKNWSKNSINNPDFFSPVSQLLRSGYAIFVLLNQAADYGQIPSFKKSWGVQKISPNKILLMINHRPHEEFQYVKILSLEELRSYILYRERIFSAEQIDELTQYFQSND